MVHLYKEERSEGVVLKSILFKESDRIITLFTQNNGIVSLLIKKFRPYTALATPLCCGEFLYNMGKTDLYLFQDGHIINDHFALRGSFTLLSAAGSMAASLIHSQLPGKPSPELYTLFLAYLKCLPLLANSKNLVASFILKLLTHEGILSWESYEVFPLPIKKEDWCYLKQITLCRSFNQIAELSVDLNVLEIVLNDYRKLI
jgi:DNA repair protein RecO (recombination protein O)